jgi:hypothetical protein
MAYFVRFRVDLDRVPADVRDEIRRTMREVAKAVSTIPPASPFWSSMKDSQLQVDVKRWRVGYRIEPGARSVVVIEVARIPE